MMTVLQAVAAIVLVCLIVDVARETPTKDERQHEQAETETPAASLH